MATAPAPAAFDAIVGELVAEGRVVHVEHLPGRPATTAQTARPLPAAVAERLPAGGLWSHQARAVDLVRARRSVVVATGTASGKSLCYQVPIAEAVGRDDRPGTALLIGPTKALARDQVRALEVAGWPSVVATTYDGDSSPQERTWARRHANVVLTNPEMLHAGLLPNHGRWSAFLARLEHVVVDELHVMRGVFGSHVAHLLRRLRRVCANYGATPTFVFCSATIGRPAELAEALCGLPVLAVTEDGSPRGPRTVAIAQPPLVDRVGGLRASPNTEAAAATARLVAAGHRTIAFCRSRKVTEVVAAEVRRRLGPGDGDLVRPYRAGYLSAERREIESGLAAGTLRGVVATSALELGVDIGGLDACVVNGFPGTVASFRQQIGRVGRSSQPSLALLVAGEDQLDQWLVAHPRELLGRPPEPAVVNVANPFVSRPHVASAAFEHPVSHDDERLWPGVLDDAVRDLVGSGLARVRPPRRPGDSPRLVWTGRGRPASGIGLRAGGGGEVHIRSRDGTLIGTVDEVRAPSLVHPGAVYLHQGNGFLVVDLDLVDRVATVEPCDAEVYTQPRSQAEIRVLGIDRHRAAGPATAWLGSVEVVTQVTGFERRDAFSREVLAAQALDLPPNRLVTRSFWFTIPDEVVAGAGIALEALAGTLHALEHAAIGLLPLFTICDRWDVGGVSTAHHADTGSATIFVHDGYPGGAGVAELGFEAAAELLAAARQAVASCRCAAGCPSCVQSPKCGNGNDPLDKGGALVLASAILDASPEPTEPSGRAGPR